MSTKHRREPAPPPPLFLNGPERDFVKQVADEVLERIVGQQVLLYAIDKNTTDYHDIYGEAMEKNYLPPLRVYALVVWEGTEEMVSENYLDKNSNIIVQFHKRRLNEDQKFSVSVGDFVLFGSRYFEIVSLEEPKNLFGQVEKQFEIAAKCKKARKDFFIGEDYTE